MARVASLAFGTVRVRIRVWIWIRVRNGVRSKLLVVVAGITACWRHWIMPFRGAGTLVHSRVVSRFVLRASRATGRVEGLRVDVAAAEPHLGFRMAAYGTAVVVVSVLFPLLSHHAPRILNLPHFELRWERQCPQQSRRRRWTSPHFHIEKLPYQSILSLIHVHSIAFHSLDPLPHIPLSGKTTPSLPSPIEIRVSNLFEIRVSKVGQNYPKLLIWGFRKLDYKTDLLLTAHHPCIAFGIILSDLQNRENMLAQLQVPDPQ